VILRRTSAVRLLHRHLVPAGPAGRARPQENGVMTVNVESALLGCHMHGHERDGNIDIKQHPACLAVHVIVPLHPAVVATRLVSKRQFLDQPMLRKQVERAIDRSVSNVRIAATDTLENLPRGEMGFRLADSLQHGDSLSCVLEPLTWHYATFRRTK
jgi:hypothetical protein